MAFDRISFLLGLGAAVALPLFTKIARPVAVQITVAGMEMFEEVRRTMAEQMEVMEDIAAEAKAKREAALAEVPAGPTNGSTEAGTERATRRLRKQRSG